MGVLKGFRQVRCAKQTFWRELINIILKKLAGLGNLSIHPMTSSHRMN